MSQLVSLSVVLAIFSQTTFAQVNNSTSKECRISTGIGFANATKNAKSPGKAVWVQLDYKLSAHFSVAMEFENMNYKQNNYSTNIPIDKSDIEALNNNFSLLVKYHFTSIQKLKISFASGWTYSIHTRNSYFPESDGTTVNWVPYNYTFDDYRIPILIEAQYPLFKTLDILARGKYNLNTQNGDNYSAAIGLSLKL